MWTCYNWNRRHLKLKKIMKFHLYISSICDTDKRSKYFLYTPWTLAGSGGVAPLSYNLSTRLRSVARFRPQSLYAKHCVKYPGMPNRKVAGWAPEAVWRFWRRDISVRPLRNRNTIPRLSSPQSGNYNETCIATTVLYTLTPALKLVCRFPGN
jgi:hypothetical protein